MKSQIGVIGLAVMGKNLALNIAEHGFTVAVYNRSSQKTKELLEAFPNLKAIVIVSGGVHGAGKAIEEMHRVGKVQIFCFDYDKEIIELIKKGIVHTAMGQDPFGQGHDPIIYLYNYLVANEIPEDITYTRTEVIDLRSVSES
jgi:methyl-accepting chemotaxis protein/ribose transport system substrate-binding protein